MLYGNMVGSRTQKGSSHMNERDPASDVFISGRSSPQAAVDACLEPLRDFREQSLHGTLLGLHVCWIKLG